MCSRTHTLSETEGRVEDLEPFCEEDLHGEFGTLEEAVARAREIAGAPDAVRLWDQRGRGIGAIDHVVAWVDASFYDPDEDEWVPCDADGEPGGLYGADPVYTVDALDGRPELRAAWDEAVRSKRRWLDYEDDGYDTVRSLLAGDGEE